MNLVPIRGLPRRVLAAVGLAGLVGLSPPVGRFQESSPAYARGNEDEVAGQPEASVEPWRAFGRVTDQEGRPLAGVEVGANCGIETLRRTGIATTDDGRYELNFGPGIMFLRGDGTAIQAATITAHTPGYFEANLPDHDAWVEAFLREGKGTSYSGIWTGDGDLLPAIPFETGRIE